MVFIKQGEGSAVSLAVRRLRGNLFTETQSSSAHTRTYA